MKNPDSLVFSINVIPDIYPTITVEELMDSILMKGFISEVLLKMTMDLKS